MKGKNIYWFSVPCTKESPPMTRRSGLWGGVCAINGFALWWDSGGEEIAQLVLTLLTCEGCDEHAHISTT